MTGRASLVLVLAALSCAALTGAKEAAAYPGLVEGSLDAVSLTGGLVVGVWKEASPSAYALAEPQRSSNFLIPAWSDEAPTRIRARLSPAVGADVALLFRTHVEGDAVYGYGLSVNTRRGEVDFLRFDGVRVSDPGVRARVPALTALPFVEVVLLMSGPTFVALVYDGETKQLLTTLAFADATYPTGGPGLYAHRRSAPDVVVTLQAGAGPAPPAPARELAAEWLVLVPDEAPLPPRLGSALRRLRSPFPGQRVFITEEPAVIALREAGTQHEAQPHVPYRFRDRGFDRRTQAKIWRTSRGIRFLDGLKDPDLIERHLVKYAERFPDLARLRSLGKSHEGRDIWALTVASDLDDRTRPTLILCAAHHANEASTPEFPLDAVRYLLENRSDRRVRRWLDSFRVVVVPLVNPDGSWAFWHVAEGLGRTNRRPDETTATSGLLDFGVDLNRNYPFGWANVEDRFNSSDPRSTFFRGPEPGSEPEVQGMMRLAEEERPVALISYHGAATKILVPYTVEGAEEPAVSVPWRVVEGMLEALPHTFAGKRYEAVRNLYPVGGVDQDWYFHRFGTLAYLIEVPANVPTRRRPLVEMVEHTRPAWMYLLDRFLDGPSLVVEVTDADGRPAKAAVNVKELGHNAGERWSTDPKTGVFFTYLPAVGSYTLDVSSGDDRQEVKIDVDLGITRASVRFGQLAAD